MTTVSFGIAGMSFEYDEDKNKKNIEKHGIDLEFKKWSNDRCNEIDFCKICNSI